MVQRQVEHLEQILGTHGTGGRGFKEAVADTIGTIAVLGHAATRSLPPHR